MAIGVVLLVLALIELSLGLRFLLAYQRSLATTYYGLFCIGVALYVGANGVEFARDGFYLAERLGWAGGMLATTFFLGFSYSFPIPRRTPAELLPLVLWPIVIFVGGALFTNIFLKETAVISYREGHRTAVGEYFWFMIIFFSVYWAWAVRNLIRSFFSSDGIHRLQLKVIVSGILVSLSASIVFDITVPLIIASRFGYVGALSTSAWLGATAYVLLKK